MAHSVIKNLFKYYSFSIVRNILRLIIEMNVLSFFYVKRSAGRVFFLSLKLRAFKG